nr:response regulator [Psychrobacter sp. UBA2769]
MARILLIEDDSTIADGIILGLKSHGMMVDWFDNAKQGELALQDNMFDAVLLDLSLPQGDGIKKLARQTDRHPCINHHCSRCHRQSRGWTQCRG